MNGASWNDYRTSDVMGVSRLGRRVGADRRTGVPDAKIKRSCYTTGRLSEVLLYCDPVHFSVETGVYMQGYLICGNCSTQGLIPWGFRRLIILPGCLECFAFIQHVKNSIWRMIKFDGNKRTSLPLQENRVVAGGD